MSFVFRWVIKELLKSVEMNAAYMLQYRVTELPCIKSDQKLLKVKKRVPFEGTFRILVD
jgi:hypothetical protein